jgi:hypothetical protein
MLQFLKFLQNEQIFLEYFVIFVKYLRKRGSKIYAPEQFSIKKMILFDFLKEKLILAGLSGHTDYTRESRTPLGVLLSRGSGPSNLTLFKTPKGF